MFYDMFSRVKLNVELNEKECGVPPFGAAEKKALRQAKKAEEAFRRSKGYPPNTFWEKVKRCFCGADNGQLHPGTGVSGYERGCMAHPARAGASGRGTSSGGRAGVRAGALEPGPGKGDFFQFLL